MERNPPLPEMLRSIAVEEHVRRAWNSVTHDHAWEHVRDGARREWERRADPID